MTMIAPLISTVSRASDSVKAGIFGRVISTDTTPLAGVAVYLGDSDHVSARTNAEGRYTISGLEPANYVVRAGLKGYQFTPETRSVTLPTVGRPSSPNAEANFVAAKRADLSISGLIRTRSNVALANVAVEVTGEGIEKRTAITGANGIYTIDKLPYGKFTVTPKLSGYTFDPTSRNVTIPVTSGEFAPNGRANFWADPIPVPVKARIFGRITNSEGEGVADIKLYLGDGTEPVATTDAEGKYLIPDLTKGRYIVSPGKARFTFDPPSRVVELPTKGKPTSPDGEANFKAKEATTQTYTVRGRVTDGEVGVGVVKIYVNDATTTTITTNSEGRYSIGKLPAGRVVIRAKKGDLVFEPATHTLQLPTTGSTTSPNGEANFAVVNPKIYAIRGRVSNGDQGVAGVGIYLGDNPKAITTTNNEGRYAIEKLAKGRYVVKAKKSDANFEPTSQVVELPTTGSTGSPDGEANFTQQAVVPSTLDIRGRVTNSGAGVSGVGIYLGDATSAAATTNSEGRYAIEGLPAGRYVVKAKKSNVTFEPNSQVVELPTSGSPGSPDGEANFTQQIVVPSTLDIRGRVTQSGVGLSGVGIYLGDGTSAAATTNAEGRYAIEGLPAGRYVVKPKKEGSTFAPANKVVELPTSGSTTSPDGEASFEVEVVAPSVYTIRGKVANSAGLALAGVDIRIADEVRATTNAEGRYAVEGLAAGTYTVTPRKTNFTFTPISATITLPTTAGDGQPNGVANFMSQETPKTYSISGTVKTSDGAAISGVTFTLGDGTTVLATTNGDGAYSVGGLAAGTYTLHPHGTGIEFTPEIVSVTLPIKEGSGAPNATRNFVAMRK